MRERFWIIRGRQTVKKSVKRCVRCRKVEVKHVSLPQQPDLPDEWVSDDPPFMHTGIDFAGPLYTSEKGANEEDSKTYVCLFTCASTRAVHLELTKRLSSEAFMLAFRRSTSRKGLPVTLLSDNARTFKSASKDIVRISRAKEVTHYMANNGVTWKFIVERAACGAVPLESKLEDFYFEHIFPKFIYPRIYCKEERWNKTLPFPRLE